MVTGRQLKALVLIACMFSSGAATGQNSALQEPLQVFQGRAIAVLDGDTLQVRRADGSLWQLDLTGIAAPPAGQRFAEAALHETQKLVLRQQVRVRVFGPSATDWAASVELPDRRDLAQVLVQAGLARWVGWCAGRVDRELEQAQASAYRQRRGIWSSPGSDRLLTSCPQVEPFRPPDELPPLLLTEEPEQPPSPGRGSSGRGCIPRSSCCRVCSKGKACGNSCISRSFTCRKGRGCACDAAEVCS